MAASVSRDKRWELTQEAFAQLLDFLSPKSDEAGKKYEEVRLRLIKIFTCRGSSIPEDLADETINRVARKVQEIGKTYVGDPCLYFYGVAKMVFLESVRKRTKPLPQPEEASPEEKELHYECLQQCMEKLTPRNHNLITEYYRGDKGDKIQRRKKLAQNRSTGVNALRIRVHRIRHSLQRCVFECLEHNAGG